MDGWTNILIPFQSKRVLVWGFNLTGNSKMYLGLHVNVPDAFA